MPLPNKYKSEKEKPILSLTKGTLYFSRLDRLFLFHLKAFHKPAELLPCDRFYFRFITRPFEGTVLQSFIEKHKTVAFPEKDFHTVPFPSTEQEEGIGKRFKMKLFFDDCCKTIYGFSHIGMSACNVDVFSNSDIA